MCNEKELSDYLERKIIQLIYEVEKQKIQSYRIEDALDKIKDGPSIDGPDKVDAILSSMEKRQNLPFIYQGKERRRRSASQP